MSEFSRMPGDRSVEDEFADESSLTEDQIRRRNALMDVIRAGQLAGNDDDEDGVFGGGSAASSSSSSKGGVSKIVSLKEKIRHTSKITGVALKSKIKDIQLRRGKRKEEKNKVALPVFGVPIDLAVERSRLCQGLELPTVFRKCIDFIEENGLDFEGIYRISGVKSKIENLKANFDKGKSLEAEFADINAVAGVFKLYLRELPESIFTSSLLPAFEQAAREKNLNQISILIQHLPTSHRLMLLWILLHFQHVINKSSENKMSAPNLVLVFSPTLHISQNLLNTLILNVSEFVGNEEIRKYDDDSTQVKQRERFISVSDIGDMNPELVAKEIPRLEQVIRRLHSELGMGQLTNKEISQRQDEIWEVQRLLTQLKRRQRSAEEEEADEDLEEEKEKWEFLGEEYRKEEKVLRSLIGEEKEAVRQLKNELAALDAYTSMPGSPDSLFHPEAHIFDFSESDAFSLVKLKEEIEKLKEIRNQRAADIKLERDACAKLRAEMNQRNRQKPTI